MIQQQAVERVRLALEQLPPDFRRGRRPARARGFSYKGDRHHRRHTHWHGDVSTGCARERLIPSCALLSEPIGEARELS